jgi:hypothetical protein
VLAERQVSTRPSNRRQMRRAAAAGLEGEADRSGVEYLVSWKELPLDQASWEAAEVRGAGCCHHMRLSFCLWCYTPIQQDNQQADHQHQAAHAQGFVVLAGALCAQGIVVP